MTWTWLLLYLHIPDSKFHEANTGPIWGQQDPGGPHVGPMNFAIWDDLAWSSSASVQTMKWDVKISLDI